MTRLVWQRYPETNGFIAYPDGVKHRYCAIWPEGGLRHGEWRWLVRIDPPDKSPADFSAGVFRNGVEATREEAVERANEAWIALVKEAESTGGL